MRKMICYRDMTFCSFYLDCKDGKDCPRAKTPEVCRAAKKTGLPICQYPEKPSCFVERGKDAEPAE